ncbi:hypothetical protein PG988_001081 [Apiospora saccharicola]
MSDEQLEQSDSERNDTSRLLGEGCRVHAYALEQLPQKAPRPTVVVPPAELPHTRAVSTTTPGLVQGDILGQRCQP